MLPAHSAAAGHLVTNSYARLARLQFTAAHPPRCESLFGSRFAERTVEVPTGTRPGAKPIGGEIHGQ